jgi:hypothetical protein
MQKLRFRIGIGEPGRFEAAGAVVVQLDEDPKTAGAEN